MATKKTSALEAKVAIAASTLTENHQIDPEQAGDQLRTALTGHQTITAVAGKPLKSYGYIIFWSVQDGMYSQPEIDLWGKDLPQSMKDCLHPNALVSSFEKATNFEGELKLSTSLLPGEDEQWRAFWTSRKIAGNTRERIILREVINAQGKSVTMLNIGVVSLNDDGTTTLTPSTSLDALPDEVLPILQDQIANLNQMIYDQVTERSTLIEAQKIRTGIQAWIKARHGVTMRGRSGGVYFISHGKSDLQKAEIVGEIKAIQNFLSNHTLGVIFAYNVDETETFSTKDTINTLLEELKKETDPMLQAISELGDKPSSRKLAAMLEDLAYQQDRVKVLNQTFDNRFTHIGINLATAKKSLNELLVKSL